MHGLCCSECFAIRFDLARLTACRFLRQLYLGLPFMLGRVLFKEPFEKDSFLLEVEKVVVEDLADAQ